MNEFDLLQLLGQVQDEYILDANERPEKKAETKSSRVWVRNLAAVLALILAAALFFRTPVGAAAVEVVKEQITRFLEMLFPPRELLVPLEGQFETIAHEAMGREPEENTPGFAIYVDTELYEMTQEGDSWFIRPKPTPIDRDEVRQQEAARLEGLSPEEQEALIDRRIEELEAFYASLPPLELEIRENLGKDPVTAAMELYEQMKGKWDYLSEIWNTRGQERDHVTSYNFTARQDGDFDAPWEVHDFFSNGEGGCFHLITRGYLEASEGFGARARAMVRTFSLVAPQDTSGYAPDQALVSAIEQELAFARKRNAELLEEANRTDLNQAEMNTIAVDRCNLWLEAHEKAWTALEQTLDGQRMEDLLWDHYEWASRVAEVCEALVMDNLGGSMSPTLTYGERAKELEERMEILLSYLKGESEPPDAPQGLIYDPQNLVTEFADAYFRGDLDAVKSMLSRTYAETPETYPMANPEQVVISAYKGMNDVPATMAQWGRVTAPVEFRETAQADSYTYLTLSLVWEGTGWKVASCGLEK